MTTVTVGALMSLNFNLQKLAEDLGGTNPFSLPMQVPGVSPLLAQGAPRRPEAAFGRVNPHPYNKPVFFALLAQNIPRAT